MPVMIQRIGRDTPMGATLVPDGAVFRTWAPAAPSVYVVTDAHATDHWSLESGSGGPPAAARRRNVGGLRSWPRGR